MSNSYTVLAEYYDLLNRTVPYDEWCDFLEKTVEKYGRVHDAIWLDLACGTGTVTLGLAERGHEMIGIDLSEEMLMTARDKAYEKERNVLWLKQDLRSFELYGTVDAAFCCLDSLNYLPDRAALTKCFRLVNNYLNPDGIFVFDVNTPKKFREVYGDRDYVLEEDGVFCGWQNHYDPKNQTCRFDLTIFAEQGGVWKRFDETQTEHCHSMKTLTGALADSGLELLSVVSDFAYTPATEEDERWFFICRGTGKD